MTLNIPFDNSYAARLGGFYAAMQPAAVPEPKFLLFNAKLAKELGLDAEALQSPSGLAMFAGNETPPGATPIAQAYAGHQFGGFSPQLGDGRAILLGEVIDTNGHRRDLQLKGSGRTPFSRSGDGKAAVGPVLREYIIGEAMHALGVPTTRALAAVQTGETVMRETPLRGAVLTRVASSHIRVGTFQFFAAHGETKMVKQLADYAIDRHFPDIAQADDPYLEFLKAVIDRQARLIAQWMNIGFVHGVMNTDNMTISGETIDYGPCAFMEAYDPETVFSFIDRHGRYAYGNQPGIAQWNLARLAETLLPLIDGDQDTAIARATGAVEGFSALFHDYRDSGLRTKLGLTSDEAGIDELRNDLFALLFENKVDFTQFFSTLADATGQDEPLLRYFIDREGIARWLARWRERIEPDGSAIMRRTNPIYIPRNHLVEAALSAAETGDMDPVRQLLDAVASPFDVRPGLEAYAKPAPVDFGAYTTYCGT